MSRFVPDMYFKSIFDIDYDKLKSSGIKVLLYDFDNTIIEKGVNRVNDDIRNLFCDLKSDFIIYVVSNSLNSSKLKVVCDSIGLFYIGNARKPFKFGYKKLSFDDIGVDQIAMIGDQIITDVWGANRMGYCSVLIDPITNSEHIWTKVNRVFEGIIFKRNHMKRGNYYD